MRIDRRWIYAAVLMMGISFLAGTLISWQMPKLRAFILVQIEQVSREHLPVRVLPGSVDLSLFPIGATLNQVKIAPKDEIRPYLTSANFETISIEVSPWQLLQGRLRLTSVEIEGAEVDAAVPASNKNEKFSLDGLFSILATIPIHRFEIANSNVRLKLADPKLDVNLREIGLAIEKRRGNSFALNLDLDSVQINSESESSILDVEASTLISRDTVKIENFKIRHGESVLELSGKANGDVEALEWESAEFKLESALVLETLQVLLKKSIPSVAARLPAFHGRVRLNSTFLKDAGKDPVTSLSLLTENLKIDQFYVDRVKVEGKYVHRGETHWFSTPSFEIDNPAGHVIVSNLHAEINPIETKISGNAHTKHLQLHQLLKVLGVGEIPVHLQISADLPCQATLPSNPEAFSLSCKGTARGENLLVRANMKSKGTIVALREFDAEGGLTVDKDKVTYSAEVKMPHSKGRSSGTIDYETGFKIDYEGDQVSFKDIANLADLKIEGTTRVKGTTEGDSDSATLAMEIDGRDFWLEDFGLGNAKGKVAYKTGQLTFSNMQGYFTVSRYAGDVRVDLYKNEIFISARSPFFDARDVLDSFSRKVQLPFAVTGTGHAQVKASGPLQFNRLSYQLKSSLFRGSVAGETFDQANFDVSSVNGDVKADRVQVIKGPSAISLTGTGRPDGTINTKIKGTDFRLENSTIVSAAGLSISGSVDFEMDMSGYVLSPDTEMRGRLTRTSIGEQGMPDSSFYLKFGSKAVEGQGTFLGDVLNANFRIPFDSKSPFALKIVSRDWNYAPILAAIAGPSSRRDYVGKLTSTIELESASGGFWNASGTARIDKLSLSRGTLSLSSTEPLLLSMKNGQVQVGKFEMTGENIFLKVTNKPNPTTKADLQVNGKLDMSLLGLLTPFFEDLRGILSFAFNLRAGPDTADLLGSAYVEKGYVKFFEFPHAIENISVDLLFNQRKILFNTMKSEIGGGRVTGSGFMELLGYKNYPINISGQFERVNLNVPENIRTSGSGNISLTGKWFPFLLKIDYRVHDGLLTKEFGGETNEADALRRDQFLPEVLLQERFTPIVVELNVDFSRGIQAKNELIDGQVKGQLTVKGNPAKPSILGNVTMTKGSRIIVKDTEFDVTTANIQFTDPNDLNPKLYVVAQARVQEYDISLLVQGTASKPDLSFSSVPQLSEKEIVSLLALGTTETGNPLLKTGQTSNTGTPQISPGALKNNPLTKEIKEKTGFEIQFDPSIEESAVVQRIVLKRQFTNKLGVTASQSLGNKRGSDAEIRYRLNEKVSGVLSWQSREEADTSEKNTKQQEKNRFGLDLEYKFEFK